MKKLVCFIMAALMMGTLTACDLDEIQSKITDAVDSVSEPVSKKEFAWGTTSGSTYKNEFAGIGYTKDEDWEFMPENEIRTAMDVAGEYMDNYELVENQTYLDMMARDDIGNNVNVGFVKAGIMLSNEETYLKHAVSNVEKAYEEMGATDFEYETGTAEIDGKELNALYIGTNINGITLYQVVCVMKVDEYMVEISTTALTESQAEEFLNDFYWL